MAERPKTPKTFSFTGFFQVARVRNLIVILASQYFAAIFLIENQSDYSQVVQDPNLFLVVLSTILIAAAGYLINDYYDVKIDLINKPDKVVVGTVLKRRTVMVAHSILNVLGISMGFYVSISIGLINLLAAFFLWLYSNQLKRMPILGNLLVAILTGMSVLLIGIYYSQIAVPVILYSAFAFTSNFVREIVKDIEDLIGDEKFGSKTLPIVWGIRNTKFFLLFFNFIFTLFLGYLLISNSFPGNRFIVYLFLLPVLVFSFLLYNADKRNDFARLSGFLKWFMLFGVLSMMLIDV